LDAETIDGLFKKLKILNYGPCCFVFEL
jgi:hypothetical protein